jgi:hypothetical protein
MLEFLNDNIFLEYGRHIFHHVIGILMGANCAPLLVHFYFLYYYLVEFIYNLSNTKIIQKLKSSLSLSDIRNMSGWMITILRLTFYKNQY